MGNFLIRALKNFSLVSARKLKCPSPARLGTFIAQAHLSRKIPARTHLYYLQIGYGDAFNSVNGWSAQSRDKYIKDALALVQPYFCHKTLGHRIKLSYSTAKYYKGYRFVINKKYEKAPYKYEDGIYQFDKVEKLAKAELGAKYLVFVSSHSVKMRELSFAQFLYFLRKVCLFFNF